MKRIAPVEKRRLASRVFDDDIALVDLSQRTVHSLNAAAALLWRTIIARRDEGTTEVALARVLCDTYDIDLGAARRDVDSYIEALVREGLVTISIDDESDAESGAPPRSGGVHERPAEQ